MRRLADRLTYRSLAIAGTAVFAGAGVATAYALPLATSFDEGWIAVDNGNMTTGLVLGLFITYAGATIVRLLIPTRKARHDASKLRQADRQRRVRTAPRGLPTRLGSGGGWSATLPTDLPEPVHVRPDPQPRQQVPACPRKQ